MQTHDSVLQEQGLNTGSTVNVFTLLLATYVYDGALGTFVPLSEVPLHLPAQLCSAARALQAIQQGKLRLNKSCFSTSPVLAWLLICTCLQSCFRGVSDQF